MISKLVQQAFLTGASKSRFRAGLVAGLVSGIVSGAPSTAWAIATGDDILRSTRAIGHLVRPRSKGIRLLALSGFMHLAISSAWGILLAFVLPKKRTTLWGMVIGVGIYVLDMVIIGRRHQEIRSLPQLPQLLDHLLYGALAGTIIRQQREEHVSPN